MGEYKVKYCLLCQFPILVSSSEHGEIGLIHSTLPVGFYIVCRNVFVPIKKMHCSRHGNGQRKREMYSGLLNTFYYYLKRTLLCVYVNF